METQEKIVNRYVEKPVKTKNGFAMLALILLLFFGSIAAMVCGPVFLSATNVGAAVAIAIAGALVLIFDLFLMPGLKILNPNEALVLTLFGKYHGTLKKDGYFWVNPFCEGINPGAQGSSMTTNLNGSTTVSLGRKQKDFPEDHDLEQREADRQRRAGQPHHHRHHCHLAHCGHHQGGV